MGKGNFKEIKYVLLTLILIILIIIFFYILIKLKDDNLIKDIKDYISSDIKVIYITDKENYSKYPIELFKKYDVDYLYINSDNLSNIEKIKIKKIINSNYLSNIIAVFEDSIIKDAIIEYDNEEKLNSFLSKYDIIPTIIGDNSNIINELNDILKTDYSLIYLPYEYSDIVGSQDEIFEEISKQYSIFYKRIDAYLLSGSQKEKLNTILKISQVNNQIVILVKDKKVVGSIRNVNSKTEYLNRLNELSFINEAQNNINYIDYNKFLDFIGSNDKNIIIIGRDDCKHCDDINKLLSSISLNYNINVNYINIKKINSEISKNIENELLKLGYSDGFTTPMVIIVEKNKLLDYVIGPSNKKYFVDIFTENGIIK